MRSVVVFLALTTLTLAAAPAARGLDAGYFPEREAALSYSFGTKAWSSTREHDLLFTRVRGWHRFGAGQAEPSRWSWGIEAVAGTQVDPESAYLVALSPLVRVDLMRREAFNLALEGGIGVGLTDIGKPDLGSTFEFFDQIGLAVRWRQGDRTLLAKLDFLHISNGGIEDPNHGVDGIVLSIGVGW